ncbi:MAG: methyltransferase domain-containing protein, partial [Alphaproteobacteria bacterium]|nr:methyltransferase domain-containing protein [Alphaproteobacteria bacterium]
MAPRDRAFVRLLVVTVLRRLGQIDDALIRCLDRPLNRLALPAKNILRLAAAQTMFLNTPGHAVADGAVRSLRPREEHLKGLVNAVSRRLIRDCQDILAEQDEVDLNCPKWLRNSWSASCGDQTAIKIIAATLMEPPLDITVKGNQQAWADNLDAKILPTGSLRCYTGGAVKELPGYDEGEWWVQDMAAALPVRLFGDVAGRAVLDLCAAPGGKTAQLAASGARVTAVDEAPNRLSLLRSNLERLGLKAELLTADVRTGRPSAPFDKILLDAPCSATGTIRRHPDIWHLCTKNDVERAAVLQDQLLRSAVE